MANIKSNFDADPLTGNMIDSASLTYCGQEGQEIFSKQIFDMDLRAYGIRFMDGLKGKRKLYTGEVSDLWQEYTCSFDPRGKVVLGEWYIEPNAIKVNLEECYDAFWDTYLVEQTSISLNGGIPQTFFDWFFNNKLLAKMGKEYHEMFWQGDKAHQGTAKMYLKSVDGVEKLLETDDTVEKIDGEIFTVDNILEQVEAAISASLEKAAEMEVDTEAYKVFMNYSDVKVLEIALGKQCCPNNQSIFSNYAKGENGAPVIMGFQVVPTLQSRNTVIVGPANNLVLGFDTFDSHIQYKLIDMRETTGENKFRVIAISNIGVGVFMPEVFVYSRVNE